MCHISHFGKFCCIAESSGAAGVLGVERGVMPTSFPGFPKAAFREFHGTLGTIKQSLEAINIHSFIWSPESKRNSVIFILQIRKLWFILVRIECPHINQAVWPEPLPNKVLLSLGLAEFFKCAINIQNSTYPFVLGDS